MTDGRWTRTTRRRTSRRGLSPVTPRSGSRWHNWQQERWYLMNRRARKTRVILSMRRRGLDPRMRFMSRREYVTQFGSEGDRCFECRDIPLLPGEVEDDWQREWREDMKKWVQEQEASGTL